MRCWLGPLTAHWGVGHSPGGAVAIRVEKGTAVLGVELGAAHGALAGGGWRKKPHTTDLSGFFSRPVCNIFKTLKKMHRLATLATLRSGLWSSSSVVASLV